MTQTERVLALLEERGAAGITALDALEIVGSLRLAARIKDLQALGHVITSEMVAVGDKRVARYVLVTKPEPVMSGMRANSMPGRPDRFVDLSKSTGLAIDQQRKQEWIDEEKRKEATPYRSTPLRIVFGQILCRACQGTGGNQLSGPCGLCQGAGVQG